MQQQKKNKSKNLEKKNLLGKMSTKPMAAVNFAIVAKSGLRQHTYVRVYIVHVLRRWGFAYVLVCIFISYLLCVFFTFFTLA